MSSSLRSSAARWSNEGEINELILKLQTLLPEKNRRRIKRVPDAEVVKEVCRYIKKLHREVDHLSERLSEILASLDHNNSVDPDMLTALLQLM